MKSAGFTRIVCTLGALIFKHVFFTYRKGSMTVDISVFFPNVTLHILKSFQGPVLIYTTIMLHRVYKYNGFLLYNHQQGTAFERFQQTQGTPDAPYAGIWTHTHTYRLGRITGFLNNDKDNKANA